MSEQENSQRPVGDRAEQSVDAPYHEPQFEAPQYEAPQYEAPQYEAPQYEAPQYEIPQYEGPQYGTPQYGTQYEVPQFDPSQNQVPGYQPEVQPYQTSLEQPLYQPEAKAFPTPEQQYQPYQTSPEQQPYQPVPEYQPQPAVPTPYPGMPVSMSYAPFGIDPVSGLPFSDKSKVIAGVLQILLGSFGVGRFYLGNYGMAIAQILVTWLTFGIGAIWPLVDGIMILVGSPRDAQGRPLRS